MQGIVRSEKDQGRRTRRQTLYRTLEKKDPHLQAYERSMLKRARQGGRVQSRAQLKVMIQGPMIRLEETPSGIRGIS